MSWRDGYKKTPGLQGFGVVSGVRSYRLSHASIHHPPCMAVGRHGQAQEVSDAFIVPAVWHAGISRRKTCRGCKSVSGRACWRRYVGAI